MVPALEIRQLSKSFGGVRAVHRCTFSVSPRTVTALIGPNGAGKTTIFGIISGILRSDGGSIILDGRDLTGLPAHRRARLGLARTFQLVRVFRNLTIRDNLILALDGEDDRFLRSAFREDRPGFARKLRETLDLVGLDKPIHTRADELSYGQTKLLELARALAKPHKLLMLDEPVAGVNPVLRNLFKELLRTLRDQGETILLIEHDMDFVRGVADHVIVMDQGSVLTEGPPEQVLRDKRVLEAYLGVAV